MGVRLLALKACAFCFGRCVRIISLSANADLFGTAFFVAVKYAVLCIAVHIQTGIGHTVARCVLRAVGRVKERGTTGLFGAAGTRAIHLNVRFTATIILVICTIHDIAL